MKINSKKLRKRERENWGPYSNIGRRKGIDIDVHFVSKTEETNDLEKDEAFIINKMQMFGYRIDREMYSFILKNEMPYEGDLIKVQKALKELRVILNVAREKKKGVAAFL